LMTQKCSIFTSGNVQHTVKCIKCEKQGAFMQYQLKAWTLGHIWKVSLQSILDEPGCEFCFGNAPFLGPKEGDKISHPSQLDISCTKPTITCALPIKTTYYQVGVHQHCAHCRSSDNILLLIEMNEYVDKYGKGWMGQALCQLCCNAGIFQ